MHRAWTSKDKFTYVKAIHKSNYSQQKSLRISSGITPYPIKPSQNMIPKDLNLQLVFTNMIKSSLDLSKKYSLSIKNIDIDINSNDFSRKTILKKIRDFFLFYNIEYKIFFKTILLYDIISIENENRKLLSSAEEIALGALILSIKFNYDENKMFSMKKFLQLYGELAYSLSNIIDIERKALVTINHFLNYTTPMCFLEFFLINGIIYNIDNLGKDNYSKIYFEIENILYKIMEESNDYLKYNFFHLACAIVAFCREIFNLEKWPKTLQKVFSVDFSLFQNEFKRFFIKKENNNNRIYDNKTYNYNSKKNIINENNNIFLLNIENLENDNDINSNNIDNINNNDCKSISSRHNYFRKNKTNYSNKTIDRYNNIINININNVSFNNIYNNNNKYKNYFNDEQNLDNNSILNRSQNSRNFSTVYYNNMKKNYIYKYNISSLQNKLRNEIKNKNYEDIKNILNNSINLDSELPEIKEEVKENIDLPKTNIYNSPKKKPKNHFYINKKEKNYIYNRDDKGEEENEIIGKNNNIIEDYNSNNNDSQILLEIRKNDEDNRKENNNNYEDKNNIEINQIYGKKYRRKYYTYTHKNNIENNIILNEESQINRNINNDKYNKKEFNNNLDNSIIENYKNKIIEDNNIRINNNNNFKENYKPNENYRYNLIRLNNNINSKLNNEINYKNNNNKNSVIIEEKKPYNILISKYVNFNHHYTEKKNLTNKSKKDIKYNISNIVPSNLLEKKNQENKNDNILKENSGTSRFRPYRRYNNLINIINDNKDDNMGDIDTKIIEKDKNKKKRKGGNKIKYNNLIKLKLSKCDSINKRKKNNNNNNY